jgi:hypothetical protein
MKTLAARLEKMLAEVEEIATDIAQSELASLDNGLAAQAWDCCYRIRDASVTGNVAKAALAALQIGEILAKLRDLHTMVQRNAEYVSPLGRRMAKVTERYGVYLAARNRGLSDFNAYKYAAKRLGVSTKTIMRAVNGERTRSVNT